MKNIISYLRIREWLDSKVTFMMGILLFFYFCIDGHFETITVAKTVAYFLYVSMFLAISYVANDFADMEIDKKAGKIKVIAHMPKWGIWFSLILMAMVGNIPILVCADNKWVCLTLIVLTYFFGLAYSTLGIRFKERGLWGLIECSFAQRCMPLLMISVLVKTDVPLMVMLLGWMVLSFVDGLRYIIIHQVNDLENDITSGVDTYVTRKRGDYRKVLLGLLILELIITVLLLIPLWKRTVVLTSAIVLFNIVLEYCIYVVIQKYAQKDILLTFDSVPMEAFYNTLFPVLSGLSLVIIDIRWIIPAVVLFIVSIKSFVVKCKIALIFIKSKVGKQR